MWRVMVLFGFAGLLEGCGAGSNLLSFLTPASHKDTWENHVALGQIYYDTLDFDSALTHAERAYELNPDSEEAAVLLGYVYMAKAELSPFSVVEKLTEDDKDQEAGEGEQSGQTEEEDGGDSGSGESGGSFGVLSGIIGLSQAEFAKMGFVNTDVKDLPVIEPVCAGEARLKVEKLRFVNKAIEVICKFVDEDVRLSEDSRHGCIFNQSRRQRRAESHFLWALAHLTEAAAFHSVINYTTTDRGKSNLELRVEDFKNIDLTDPSQITVLIERLKSLAHTIDQVLQVTGFCSEEYPQTQLIALVNDLIAISYAFSKMPGIPDSMVASINAASESIVRVRNATSGVARTQSQAAAAKGDLTSSITKGVVKVLDKAKDSNLNAGQVDSLCSSYEGISGGGGSSESNGIPEICQ